MAEPMTAVGVVGGGLMGSGIAQVAAQAGFRTTVREVSDALCDKARRAIERSLAKGVERGKVTAEQRDAALGHLTFTTDLGAIAASDLVIEAIVEDLGVKNALWTQLDPLCPARTIFASNTSSQRSSARGRGDRAESRAHS